MKSMLIIDGSATITSQYAEVFEKRGWVVTTCADRDSAMRQLVGDELYGVVLLSYQVQGTDGVKLVRFTRALDHRRTTAIVMVTENNYEAEEARWAGADRALVSPVNSNSLIHVVEEQAK